LTTYIDWPLNHHLENLKNATAGGNPPVEADTQAELKCPTSLPTRTSYLLSLTLNKMPNPTAVFNTTEVRRSPLPCSTLPTHCPACPLHLRDRHNSVLSFV
jgi:hypothetical protein